MTRLRRLFMAFFERVMREAGRTVRSRTTGKSSERPRSWPILALAAGAPEVHARGVRLLQENLSAAQREQREKHGYFDVVGGDTGRRYRIGNGAEMNIQMLDEKGRAESVLCFMPEGDLPVGDVMLAQKLALELFEREALKTANKLSVQLSRW